VEFDRHLINDLLNCLLILTGSEWLKGFLLTVTEEEFNTGKFGLWFNISSGVAANMTVSVLLFLEKRSLHYRAFACKAIHSAARYWSNSSIHLAFCLSV